MTSTPPMRCLVVSSNRLIRWSLVEYLEARGLEARSTPSNDVAAALLQEWPVDLLIADPSEPGTSGLLTRSQDFRPRPRIILLADDKSAPTPIEADQLGVFGVIETPCMLAALGRLLGRIMESPPASK